jgi:hypothetical protein
MDRFRAERDKIVQERKIQLDELKAYADMDKAQLTTSLSVIGAMRDFLRDKPDATPEEINTAKTQFNAMGVKAGAPNQDELLTLMGNQRTLAQVAGKYLPWVEDSKQLGVGANILKGMAKAGASEDDMTSALAKMFGPGVSRDAFDAVREVSAGLKKSEKVDKDGYPDPLTIIDQVASRGVKGPVMAEFLLGQNDHLKLTPRTVAFLEQAGLRDPEAVSAAMKARDIKRGEVEGGALDLKDPVNAKLIEAGLDPRKMDPNDKGHQAALKLARAAVKSEAIGQAGLESQARAQGELNVSTSPQAIQGAAAKAGAIARAEEPSKIAVSAATGKAAMELKIKSEAEKPVSAKDRANYIDVNALRKDGVLRQAPPGTTYGNIDRLPGYAYIDDKQKERLTALTQAQGVLDQVDALSAKVITQNDWGKALAEGGQKAIEARIKSDPVAATFLDTRKSFTGNLSRALGSERGVLTDTDINRMSDAQPNFGDSKPIRDLKVGLMRDIWTTNQAAVVGEVTGVDAKQARSKINELLEKMETANPRTKEASQKAAEERLRARTKSP